MRNRFLLVMILVLFLVFGWLFVESRRVKGPPAATMTEELQVSKPTAIRILGRGDLEITASSQTMLPAAPPLQNRLVAAHRLRIRNSSGVSYQSIALEILYRSQSGALLEKRSYTLKEPVSPGSEVEYEFRVEDLLPEIESSEIQIRHSDISPTG